MKSALYLMALTTASIALGQQQPPHYDDFKLLSDFPSLREAIGRESFILLPTGEHVIDNPIVIDQDRPLYLLGITRQCVQLTPKNVREPMFIVKRVPFLKCAYFSMGPDTVANDPKLDLRDKMHGHRAFWFQNTEPLHFEWQGMYVNESALEIQGPGTFIIRSSRSRSMGVVPACLIVDHPQAEVFIHGGIGMTRGTAASSPLMKTHSIIWKKRGHLELQTAGGEQTGRGLVQIDTPSPKGADILTHIRSEGTKESRAGDEEMVKGKSCLLYVPPTKEKVNVLLQCSRTAARATKPPGQHTYADYNGAGTLWLLGNNSKESIGTLVEGQAPDATIIALGNTFLGNRGQLQVEAARKVAVGNLLAIEDHGNGPLYQRADAIRIGLDQPLSPPQPMPIPPAELLTWKGVPDARVLKSVKDFGALGDGRHDDTAALQKAIEQEGWRLFFPAGHYRITWPLGLNNSQISRVTDKEPGGWWSGAGSERTIIENTEGGSVLISHGIAFYKFDGLTFKTLPHGESPCVEIDNVLKLGGVNCKAQHFLDCQFIGGSIAFGIGIKVSPQVDFHCFDRCTFAQAKQGFAIGSFNNVQEIVQHSRFIDNDIDCGHTDLGQHGGGNAAFYDCTTSGCRGKFLHLGAPGTALWYFQGVRGTVPSILDMPAGRSYFGLAFDNCDLTGKLTQGCAGALSFHHSRLGTSQIELPANPGPLEFITLTSTHTTPETIGDAEHITVP